MVPNGLSLNTIKKFEENNPKLSVNVFGAKTIRTDRDKKGEILGPFYKSFNTEKTDDHKHINLLIVKKGNNVDREDTMVDLLQPDYSTFHYVWIKDLSK